MGEFDLENALHDLDEWMNSLDLRFSDDEIIYETLYSVREDIILNNVCGE